VRVLAKLLLLAVLCVPFAHVGAIHVVWIVAGIASGGVAVHFLYGRSD